jgi:hypothetical protein
MQLLVDFIMRARTLTVTPNLSRLSVLHQKQLHLHHLVPTCILGHPNARHTVLIIINVLRLGFILAIYGPLVRVLANKDMISLMTLRTQ